MIALAMVWAALLPALGAEPTKPIDLKPFLGKSQFQSVNADWILPRGRQVVEGIPFQIDGIVEVAGASARFSNVGRTNVDDIPINATFERFYLLAAASRDVNEGVAVARFAIRYADDTTATLPIEYGRHVSDWMGPRHKGESPLIEPDARVAWQVQHPAAAKRDDSLRLFYLTLANPSPTKEVRSISLISTRARGGFMLAALTVGSEAVDRQPDTFAKVEEHFHLEGAPGDKPSLTGRVTDEQGQPVAGAMVRVLSVKTIDTTDPLTPADSTVVGQEAQTDANGRYRLEKLSERLLYRLMVVSPKSQPVMFDGADPLAGPSDVRLLAGSGATAGEFMVQARLVGQDDKPVVGASIKPDGVGTGPSTSWGGNHGFPSEVVTGLNGEFIMARDERFTRLSVNIKAAGLAPAKIWLPISNGVQTIKLGVGAVLTGRITKDGQPMADAEVGVAGVDRSSEVFAGHFEVKTDAEGRFKFEHLPPQTDWWVYGVMRSMHRDGSVPPRRVTSGEHGSSSDVGELKVQPGITLAGKIQTADGQPLPSGLRLTISLNNAWDNQSVRIERNGAFQVTGLHTGLVEVYLSAREWSLTGENRSLDDWNPWRLTGLLQQDKRDLLMIVEKKDRNYNSWYGGNGSLPEVDRASNRPLSGAEPSGPPPIHLAGSVVDDQSGKPIPSVRIIPGRKPPSTSPINIGGGLIQSLLDAARPRPVPWNERPFWEMSRAQDYLDGHFSIATRRLTSLPILRVEAPGYDVLDTPPYAESDTNIVLRLKKGFGPKGILLGPDGRPAAGVTMVFGAEHEQFSLNADTSLTTYDGNRSTQTTKPDGSFAFASKANGKKVFAASEAGWAGVSLKSWPADGRIRLLSWGKANGALTNAAGQPVANVQVAIELNRDYDQGDPWVNFQDRPTTDAAGKFSFQHVPPGDVRLVHLVPMNRGGWMHAIQTNFTVQAGATVELGPMKQTPAPPGSF
jgi:uncharacterized GH25 family protein